MANWDIKINYDYRFGGFHLHPISPEGQDVGGFVVTMESLIKGSGMKKHELLAMIDYSENGRVYEADPEKIRRDLMESTDFKDRVVLDIGGYDGKMAKWALNRGASRAICLDNHQYEHYGWDEYRFDGVEYIQGDFMLWKPNEIDTAQLEYESSIVPQPNIVIFFNILYHLKNPWAALDHLREIIDPSGEMLLCSLFRYNDEPWMYVYEERECNPEDISVYFGPSLGALERLLTATGWSFEQTGVSFDRVCYRCKPNPNFEAHPWKS